MSNNSDKLVQDLLIKVEERKEAIKKLEKPQWNTTCSFSYREDAEVHDRVMIQTVIDPNRLINILAFLRAREVSFVGAAEELGIKKVVFKWMGYTVKEWAEDLQLRLDIVKIGEKRKDLEKKEKQLDTLMSPEMKRKLALEKIQAELNSDDDE